MLEGRHTGGELWMVRGSNMSDGLGGVSESMEVQVQTETEVDGPVRRGTRPEYLTEESGDLVPRGGGSSEGTKIT